MNYVGFIHSGLSDNELYGGKGSKLITLANLGIKVPPGFILNTKSYKTFIEESKFTNKIHLTFSHSYSKDDVFNLSKTIRDYILNSDVPKNIIAELTKVYNKFKKDFGKETSFAVRSSANIEDSDQFSFAGQAESFLNNQSFQDIFLSIKKCWASLFSPQALLYILHMRKNGKHLSLFDLKIAVIIQKMILSECAGVLFTANVMNNNCSQMMINSTWGLGDVITSNTINPDLIIINKLDGSIVDKVIGEKEKLSIANPNRSFTQLVEMGKDLRNKCSLNDNTLKKLYLLGMLIEKNLKTPQDIEWAIENDEIYVLQSRSSTTLKK
ncbi:MAG: PEP/pyruvate-binding domain-containing protein [Candidatus Lokiarchaeota archaeon]